MSRIRYWFGVFGVLAVTSCASEARPQRSAQPTENGPAPQPTPQPSLPPSAVIPSGPLAARLESEARAHPSRSVHIEDLRSALEARGVTFARTRQVLGSPLGAAYCEAAFTTSGLGLSVCEFADAAAASEGAARSREVFDRLIPGRTLLVRENALLTLTSSGAEAELAGRVFAELTPTERSL